MSGISFLDRGTGIDDLSGTDEIGSFLFQLMLWAMRAFVGICVVGTGWLLGVGVYANSWYGPPEFKMIMVWGPVVIALHLVFRAYGLFPAALGVAMIAAAYGIVRFPFL